MARWTFKQLAQFVLEQVKQPLTADEIWEVAKNLNCSENVASVGKTPARSISAQLYTETADNENSVFIRVGQRPTKFFLRNIKLSSKLEKDTSVLPKNQIRYKEKDLHKILSSFVNSDPHFRAKTKTINHLKSSRKQAGKNEWLHPDIVGIHFPFTDYSSKKTLNLQKLLSTASYKFFSFELKIKLDMAHLREYYFQAVSNSSWAHEGYLVVNELDRNDDLMDELRRLNNAFGIGLIELDAENFEQSEVILFARHNDELDWLTIDQLAANTDFIDFLDDVEKDCQTACIRGKYDAIYKDATEARDDLQNKGVLPKKTEINK